MLLQNKKVAIIGAGPVGLTLAKLLQQEGVNVNVYERDINEHARIKGGTLDLLEDMGQKVFKKAGLLTAYFNNARPTARRIADVDGNIIKIISPSNNPEIDRNDLRRILLESLQPGTVVWNRKFVSLEEQNERFLINFENAVAETADLVIGANGITSNIRKNVTDKPARYTGTVTITGEVFDYETHCPNFKKLCGEDKIIAKDGHVFFLSQPKNDGALYYYACFQKPESWIKSNNLDLNDCKQICEFLNDLLADWNNAYKELLNATNEFTMLSLRQVPLENWRPHKHITLIGDAAHGMPPYAGVGVNTGLLDAFYLSENLTNAKFENIQTPLNDYEEKMFGYASEAQQQTAVNERQLFHSF